MSLDDLKKKAETRKNNPKYKKVLPESVKREMYENAELLYASQYQTIKPDEALLYFKEDKLDLMKKLIFDFVDDEISKAEFVELMLENINLLQRMKEIKDDDYV